MDNKGFREYRDQREQTINAMSPNELLLLLYDELVKRLMRAELALNKENFDLFEADVSRSLEIIRYLDDTLDRQYEVGRDLARLYEFFSYELSRVKAGRNKTELARVKTMVSELRDTFREADKNNQAQAAGAAGGAVTAMEQEHLTKVLVQVKRMGNLLNEVLDLSQQMAEALNRNDQVAVEMLIAMRQEPISKLEAVKQALEEQTEELTSSDDILRLSLLLNGGEAERPEEQILARQVAANQRRLNQVLELEKVLNRKVTRDKSIY